MIQKIAFSKTEEKIWTFVISKHFFLNDIYSFTDTISLMMCKLIHPESRNLNVTMIIKDGIYGTLGNVTMITRDIHGTIGLISVI